MNKIFSGQLDRTEFQPSSPIQGSHEKYVKRMKENASNIQFTWNPIVLAYRKIKKLFSGEWPVLERIHHAICTFFNFKAPHSQSQKSFKMKGKDVPLQKRKADFNPQSQNHKDQILEQPKDLPLEEDVLLEEKDEQSSEELAKDSKAEEIIEKPISPLSLSSQELIQQIHKNSDADIQKLYQTLEAKIEGFASEDTKTIFLNCLLHKRAAASLDEARQLLQNQPIGSFYVWPSSRDSENMSFGIKIQDEKNAKIKISAFQLKQNTFPGLLKLLNQLDQPQDVLRTFLILEAQKKLVEGHPDDLKLNEKPLEKDFDYRIFVDDMHLAMDEMAKGVYPKMTCLLKLGTETKSFLVTSSAFHSLMKLNKTALSPDHRDELLKLWGQGKLVTSKQDVETALKNAPDYDFRVWPSESQEGAISYAVKMPWGLIDVRRLDESIQHQSHSISFLIQAGTFLLEQDKTLSQKIKKQPKSVKKNYDHQLILNLGSGNSAKGLTGKAKKRQLNSHTIDLRNQHLDQLSKEQSQFFQQLSHQSRIYMIGHCNKGKHYIISDEGVKITAEQFADMIAKHAPQLKDSQSSQKLRISVVACYGGAHSAKGNESFSSKLCHLLQERGIDCEVIGRVAPVSRWDGRENGYEKRVEGRHHHTGDKIIFRPAGKAKTRQEIFQYPNSSSKTDSLDPDLISLDVPLNKHILNIGSCSKTEAEHLLKEQSKRSSQIWLIRQDPSTGDLMFSALINGKYVDDRLTANDLTLNQLFADLGFQKFCSEKGLDLAPHPANHALFIKANHLAQIQFSEQTIY